MTPRQQAIEAIRKKLKGVAAPPWFPDWDKHTATAALDSLLAALPNLGLAVVPLKITKEIAMALESAPIDDEPHEPFLPSETIGWAIAWRDALAAAPSPLAEEPQP